MSHETDPTARRTALRWTLVAVVVVLAILATGHRYDLAQTEWVHEKQARELEAICALKVDQIVQWREERLSDAQRSAGDPLLRRALEAWLRSPRHASDAADLRETLRIDRDAYDYADVLLVGGDGGVLLAAGDHPIPIGPATRRAVEAALAGAAPRFSDPFRTPEGGLLLDAVAPISGRAGPPLGVLVLRTDPDRYLYPLIQSWPLPSRCSELLIVDRDGDEVRVLNRLRHQPDAVLSLRFSLARTDLAAVRAVLGERGVVQALDYRGIEVLAATSPIPRSDWSLVAKVDASEILAESRYRAAVAVSFTALAVLLAVLAIAFVYRRRQATLYRHLYLSEREQSKAEGRFRTVLYSIGDAVITTDPDGRVVQLNLVAEQLTGWTEADAAGQPLEDVFQIVDEETRTRSEPLGQRVLRDEHATDRNDHAVLLARDGVERPIAESAAPIRDEDGAVIGAVILFRDQTGARAAQQELREREERFRSIVENEPECVKIVSLDGRLLEINPAGLRLIEAETSEQVLERNAVDLVHPDDRAGFLVLHHAAARGDVGSLDFRILGLHGAVRWVETRSAPLRDGSGNIVSVLSVTRDITDRREAEEKLRQSEALLRIAGSAARLGGWAVDFASRQMTWSDEVCALHELPTGTSPSLEECVGYYAPEWRDVFTRSVIDCALRGTPLDCEAELLTATGRRIWVRVIGHAERDAAGVTTGLVGAIQDVTERKQAEAQVRRLAERLTATLESITDAFFMLDREWRFLYVNPEAERLLQASCRDLAGRVLREKLPESAGSVFERECRRAVAERRAAAFEAFYPPLDAWFEVRAYPSDEGLAIYFQDVSERRRTREEQREGEERLLRQRNSLIALTGPEALDADDLPSALHRIVETAAHTLGVARASVWRFDADRTSIHPADSVTPESEPHAAGAGLTQAACPAYFRALLEQDVIVADDARNDPQTRELAGDYLHPHGITSMLDVPIRLGGTPDGVLRYEHVGPPRTWRSDEKTFAVAISNLVALTLEQWERKRADAMLRYRVEIEGFLARSSVRFLSISPDESGAAIDEVLGEIGNITGADRSQVFELDEVRGRIRHTHEWCMPGVESRRQRMHAFPYDALPWFLPKLRNFESIHLRSPEDLPPEADLERELLIEQGVRSMLMVPIFWRHHLHGFLGLEALRSAHLWSDEDRQALETLANTVALALERTQSEATREQLESQLRQAQKLEAVGRLAGGVAHDFNNMLTVILGHADMALEKLDAADPIHANLEQIMAVGQRSADLTRQLLAFARQQTIAPRVLDLNDTIASALNMLGRLIGENIDLVWRPGKAVRSVKIDPAQLDQILANLAVNARDAISGVGRVVIATEVVELDEAYCSGQAGLAPGYYTVLDFGDTGRGMGEEALAHAFEPFFTTKAPGDGTGLGLATVYGILKQNHGHISACSKPGDGTTFRIFFPSHDIADADTVSLQPVAPIPPGTETILLVEDEAVLLRLVTRQLAQLGYHVLAASLPREAIALAEQHPGTIHLLMTDVIMPDMNGRDLWKRLSGLRPDMKSLFTSGYTADIIGHQGVLDEGISFLQKPFTRAVLAVKLREVLAASS